MKANLVGTTDAYLAELDWREARESLARLRAIILEEAPDATECISYGMPGFKLNGYLCGFAAFKNHCSFFPGAIALDFENELKGFKLSKGTIQFHPDKPIPEEILRAIVRKCVARRMTK
ncbi:MAG: DUF1801 domain-containing protein [Fimbriimonadaceae bacterium]